MTLFDPEPEQDPEDPEGQAYCRKHDRKGKCEDCANEQIADALMSEMVDPFLAIKGRHSPIAQETPQSFLKSALQERIKAAIHGYNKRQEPKPPSEKGSTKFTTKAGIAWDAAQPGWTLRHSERSEAYKKGDRWVRRTRDLAMAVDAEYSVDGRLIGRQYGGPHEEAAHRRKFDGLGGVDKAREMYSEVWYVAFVRNNPKPVKIVRWL